MIFNNIKGLPGDLKDESKAIRSDNYSIKIAHRQYNALMQDAFNIK